MTRAVARAIFAALVSIAALHPAMADPARSARDYGSGLQQSYVQQGVRATAPFAYTRFCVLNPQDCVRAPVQTVEHDRVWNIVTTVNLSVNRSMRAVNESRERWSVGGPTGDCEDFALTKRRELIRRGVPASALRIAVARTYAGEGHAVLVVGTSAGDFVLDNLTNRIVPWHKANFRWLKIASPENPRVWFAVGTGTAGATS